MAGEDDLNPGIVSRHRPGKKFRKRLIGGSTPEASMFLVPRGFSGPDLSFQEDLQCFQDFFTFIDSIGNL